MSPRKNVSGTQTVRGARFRSRSSQTDSEISRIAAREDNVIGIKRLYGLGLTYEEIRGRVRRSFLHPRHRGVFSVGHGRLTPKGELRAALLTFGPDSFLSHRSSAAWKGLRSINPYEVHVTVVADHTPRARDNIIVHRTSKPPHRSEIRTNYGLRSSSWVRMMLEVAPAEPADEIIRLVTESVRRGVADFDAMRRALDRHEHRPGTGILDGLLHRYLDTTARKSQLEYSFDAHAETDERIPVYEKNVHLGPYEIDCLFREQRVAVELDGRPFHVALKDTDRDRAKDTYLQLHGLWIMRITDFRWEYARLEVIDDLLAMLALHEQRPGQQRAA
jgi:very-short-patch-repair endonuclease